MIHFHNTYKLISREDGLHIHKILGIVCMAHYIYRYYLLLTTGSMHLRTPTAYRMVGVHGLLSCSSMIFHIPKHRIRGGPMIYPEYRLHSILFALRSVACYYLTYHDFPKIYNILACFATMYLADIVSKVYPSGTTTMRQMPFDERIAIRDREHIISMQSVHQIVATMYMVGNEDSCFSPLFAIHFAAFLMTLVRKSIITTSVWHLLYNGSLAINVFCLYSLSISYIYGNFIAIQLFYYWRFNTNTKARTGIIGSKYVGWAIVFQLYLYYYNNYMDYVQYMTPEWLEYCIARALIIVYCAYQVSANRVFIYAIIASCSSEPTAHQKTDGSSPHFPGKTQSI